MKKCLKCLNNPYKMFLVTISILKKDILFIIVIKRINKFHRNGDFMHSKKPFSIIELMTVVLVILLLITLTIPVFVNLKMNARAALCKGNLRQMGILITAYQADHRGYLPYKNANGSYSRDGGLSDIPKPSVGNNELYRNWNGHLLPYMDVYLPDKYTRKAMVTKMECTRFFHDQLGGPENPPPSDILKNGWVVVDDAYRKGGYQDLKTFICPEIHSNTIDIMATIKYNGIKIPRISQLCNQGFQDHAGYDYGMNGGIPTTYLANDIFFGYLGNKNSYRMDEINDIANKALIIEGGFLFDPIYVPYYSVARSNYYGVDDGSDLSASVVLNKNSHQKTTYAHDNYKEFWVMNSQIWSYYFPSMWMGRDNAMELANKFNSHFKGKASMISGCQTSSGFFGFSIVSFIDPENGEIFKDFFKANNPGVPLTNFVAFRDEPNEYQFLTGNMNVLFGDGSVMTKDQAWLCNNRRKIGMQSQD